MTRTDLTAPGDWPRWRRDGGLTAHQPLPGASRAAPEVRGRHFLGTGPGAVRPAALTGPAADGEHLVLARARLYAYGGDGTLLWEYREPGYWLREVLWVADLDGDGRAEIAVSTGDGGVAVLC